MAVPPGRPHRRRRVGGDDRRRRRGRRGHRRHRAGPQPDPRRAQGGQARRHRQQGAAGQRRRRAVRGCRRRAGVDLLFEAAVGGGIPLIRPLRESLAGERITRVMGIVNGTTNYILTRMTEAGASYSDALAEAQTLGYAERDPTADVEGFDAAAKARHPRQHRLRRAGSWPATSTARASAAITAADIAFADRLGYVVKLLAIAEQVDGEVAVRVHPAMVPDDPPAGGGARVVQRRVHRGRGGRRADALRPGRGRHAHGAAPCSATSSTPPTTCGPAARAGPRRSGRATHPAHRRAALAVLRAASRWPTGPACWPPSPASSATTACRSAPWSRRALGDEARLIFITHTARERDVQATLARPARARRRRPRRQPAPGRSAPE